MGKWDGWRTIEEFPAYQINSDGDIRKRDTWYQLTERCNPHTGAYYYQLNKNGRSHSRNYIGLLYVTWPELLEAWRPIPGFSNYLIDRTGQVMGTIRWKELPMTRFESYNLKKDGRAVTFRLDEFDWTVFDNYEEIPWHHKAMNKIVWRAIPGKNSHQVSRHGHIRHARHRWYLTPREYFPAKHPGELFVKFSEPDGSQSHMKHSEIVASAWPETVKEAA